MPVLAQPENAHRRGRLAWLLTLGSALLLVPDAVLQPAVGAEYLLGLLIVLAYLPLGGLIARRRPGNPIGWLMLAGAAILAGQSLAGAYATSGLERFPGRLPAPEVAAWVGNWAGNLGFSLMMLFPLLLFPTGRLPSPRWRPVGWLAGLALAAVAFDMIRPGPLGFYPDVENPFGAPSLSGAYLWLGPVRDGIILLLMVAIPASLFWRYRRGGAVERLQIKWLAYGAGLIMLVTALVVPAALLFGLAEAWLNALFGLLVLAVPASMGVAILRHRLFDIDLIIRKTLVYAILSGMLALAYAGSVVLLQGLLAGVNSRQSPLVIVTSTLLIAALFQPLRRRVQALIDRRFYRRKYDAAHTLLAFAVAARDETDLAALTAGLITVIQEALQPGRVNVWLGPAGDGQREATSTSTSRGRAAEGDRLMTAPPRGLR